MQALQYGSWAIGLGLNLLVISALSRGSYRKYPFVLLYSVALLLSTVVEIAIHSAPKPVQDDYYWGNEIILDVLVFCLVIAFIDEASHYSRQRPIPRLWLIALSILFFGGSFVIHHGPHLNRQMTLVSRDLNICAVILDLVLWSLLMTARRPNRQLLLLSGGLGLQLTGAIMGESLRHLSRHLFLSGTLLEVTTGFLGLYVWWWALRGAYSDVRHVHRTA
ncbi:MAG TPA: hypothetical protein VMU80_04820 [Bryobacteraceae bacterium]|nr:hypothetical protein [Bryobacteraceae bacterium]